MKVPFSISLSILLCFTLVYGQINLQNGLIGYWPFDGNVKDSSGNGNNCAVNGTIGFTSDRFGRLSRSCEFNGVNSYLVAANSPSLQSPDSQLTISLWINAYDWDLVGNHWVPILSKSNTASDYGQYRLGLADVLDINYTPGTSAYFSFDNGKAWKGIPFSLNHWYFVLVTYCQNVFHFYVNGSLAATANYTPAVPPMATNMHLEIGRDIWDFPEMFFGAMDELRIYNRCLNQDEIDSLYGQGSPPFHCDGDLFLSAVDFPSSTNTNLVQVSIDSPLMFNLFGTLNTYFNAIGFNQNDNYIYAIDQTDKHVVRIGSDESSFDLGLPIGLSPGSPGTTMVGGATNGGYHYVTGSGNHLYKINLSTLQLDSTALVYSNTGLGSVAGYGDIAFDPLDGNLYGYTANQFGKQLTIINPLNGVVDTIGAPQSFDSFGALFFDNDGELYGYGKATASAPQNSLYHLNKITGLITFIATSNYEGAVDGCSCPVVKPCSPMDLVYSITDATPGQNDGAVKVNVSGGTPPYQYSLDNITYQGSSTFTSLSAGTYTVYVMDDAGCVQEGTFTIEAATGINPVSSETFQVYPNPFTREIQIEFEAYSKNEIAITLFDLLGRSVFNSTRSIQPGENTITIEPISELTSGIYFLEVRTGERAWKHKLIRSDFTAW